MSTATKKSTQKPATSSDLTGIVKAKKLVVTVVYDQLASWVLKKYLPYLDENGAIKQLMKQGKFYSQVAYPYLLTYTAPGHTTIHTGIPPNLSGINVNELPDRRVEPPKKSLISDDHVSRVLAMSGSHVIDHYAGPGNLRVATDGDILKTMHPDSKVVSLSNKSRAAIFSGGQRADIAIWSETMADPVQFATSSHYMNRTPAWLEQWNDHHPIENYTRTWQPENPALYSKVLGKHHAKGKTDWESLGKVFPHEIKKSNKPGKTYRTSPFATEHLIDLAATTVKQYQLCQDASPDLLALSISSIDYAGHTFGVESWEYLDNLIRSDRIVGEFLAKLRVKCDYSVMLTADHGVASSPKRDDIIDNHYIVPKELGNYLNKGISAYLKEEGKGTQWLKQEIEPFPIFLQTAKTHPKFNDIKAHTLELLKMHPDIKEAYYVEKARTWTRDPDRVKRAVALSIRSDQPEEIVFVAKAHQPIWPHEGGTSHGSPWDYDRYVPVLIAGQGFTPTSVDSKEHSMLQVAPTTLKLLGLAQPATMKADPLQ